MLISKVLLALCTFQMQSFIQNNKHNYFNIYKLSIKLLLLIVCCFLFACSQQKETQQVLLTKSKFQISENAININSASAEELEKLPQVGAKLAQEIIDYRENFGKFRKPEHLLLIRGVSDKKFREIRSFIKIERFGDILSQKFY